MGGYIKVESVQNQGSTFSFVFKLDTPLNELLLESSEDINY